MGRQTEELIEEYGIETLTEMLDLFEIIGDEPVAWRQFALKYKIIKKTTKIITPQIRKRYVTTKFRRGEDGKWSNQPVEPHDLYSITLANGRGEYVFQTSFTNLDVEKWRREYA